MNSQNQAHVSQKPNLILFEKTPIVDVYFDVSLLEVCWKLVFIEIH